MAFDRNLARVSLGFFPTPLDDMTHLTAALGGPRLLVKRDDLSGLALGGNKCRKLEYLLGEAKAKGVDTVITSGSAQSNFALQMAAAARKLGMEPYLLLVKGIHNNIQGNLLLHRILNTRVTILESRNAAEMFTTMPARMAEFAEELKRQGHNPMVIPAGGASPLGVAGWVSAAIEISGQLKERGLTISAVVLANGSGSTQAGLVLGFRHLGLPVRVAGISVLHPKATAVAEVTTQANEAARLLGMDIAVSPGEVIVYDDYVGPGYGVATKECLAAIKLMAQSEGIFLDPVYTGKALAGLIDLSKKDYFTRKETVLFIHTGGVAATFAYNDELSK